MLQQIETQGKTYPLNFGIRTVATVADSLGLTMDKLIQNAHMSDMSLGELVKMVVSVTSVAMTEGARKSGTPHRYTEDDVADMIDADGELLPRLILLFRTSLSAGGAVFQTATAASPVNPGNVPAARSKKKK